MIMMCLTVVRSFRIGLEDGKAPSDQDLVAAWLTM